MIKKFILATIFASVTVSSNAQTTLYTNNFEGSPGFNLNTTTLGGTTSGDNPWIINNIYAGGTGSLFCAALNTSFPFTVPTTVAQPIGISPSNSFYLHITPREAVINGGTLPAASYFTSDGTCIVGVQTTFAEMMGDISTIGFDNVAFNFWWACGGSSNCYGRMYYSTNSGVTWIPVTCPVTSTADWFNQTSWLNSTVSDPNWNNQSTLRFAFSFRTAGPTGADLEPSFAIDNIAISGINTTPPAVATSTTISPASWCQGSTIPMNIGFTASGAINSGNIYTAQLSDANGNFTTPLSLGTLATSATGPLSINATIPSILPAGTGYRIRVTASDPNTIGSDNGSDLIIHSLPNVTLGAFADLCLTDPSFVLSGGNPVGGIYVGTGVSAGSFDPSVGGIGTHPITYQFSDVNGCSGIATQTITVDDCSGLFELANVEMQILPNPTNNSFSIITDRIVTFVEIYNLDGQLLKHFDAQDEMYAVSNLPSGLYIVVAEIDNKLFKARLVVQ